LPGDEILDAGRQVAGAEHEHLFDSMGATVPARAGSAQAARRVDRGREAPRISV